MIFYQVILAQDLHTQKMIFSLHSTHKNQHMTLSFELLLIYNAIREENYNVQGQGQTLSYFPIKINIKFITLSGHCSQMKPSNSSRSTTNHTHKFLFFTMIQDCCRHCQESKKILLQKINPPKQINHQKNDFIIIRNLTIPHFFEKKRNISSRTQLPNNITPTTCFRRLIRMIIIHAAHI